MNSELRKQQSIVIDNPIERPTEKSHVQQTTVKSKTKKSQPTQFEQFLERESVISALQILIIVLFVVFVIKLCCKNKDRDPRIIRGRGTGSNVGGGGKTLMNISSKKSNHRHGMKAPKVVDISESSSSSEDQGF